MRDTFHDELDSLWRDILSMIGLARAAMADATRALLAADLAAAERVIADDRRIDALRNDLELRALRLIAQQQPVARDLRALVASVHVVADVERMGDLAQHVAMLARRRYPEAAVPVEAVATIARMGSTADAMSGMLAEVIDTRDVVTARRLEEDDDVMDSAYRGLFQLVLSSDWRRGTEAAVDLALLGRYYERYADHVVAVARQIVFVITGDRAAAQTQ